MSLGSLLASVLSIVPPAPESPLSWEVSIDGCPDASNVESRLPPPTTDVEYDHYAATVERDGSAWVAHLEGPASRELRAATCEELADAVVLLVELSIQEAEEASATEEPAPAPEPAVMPEPEPKPEPAPTIVAPADPPLARSSPAWGLAAVGGATFVVVPTAAPGFEIYGGPRGVRWAVDLGLVGRPRFHGAAIEPTDVGADLATWLGVVRACGVPRAGPVEFPLCGGMEIGALTGRGSGDLAQTHRAASPWVAARFDGGLRFEVHPRIRPTLWVSGIALVTRPSFVIEGTPEGRARVCCEEPLGVSAGAGIEVRFSAKTRRAGH